MLSLGIICPPVLSTINIYVIFTDEKQVLNTDCLVWCVCVGVVSLKFNITGIFSYEIRDF